MSKQTITRTRATLLIVGAAMLLPLSAFADTYPVGPFPSHEPSSVTRAQVQAELAAYRKNPVSPDGWRDAGGDNQVFVGIPGAVSKSRAQVRMELLAHRAMPVTVDGWDTISETWAVAPRPLSASMASVR
jgi:Domain of unknown function (DUF4148)